MNQESNSFNPHSGEKKDAELIQLAKQGDKAAFNALYERYFSSVFKRVGYLIPTEDVDDVTQEVFIAMIQSLKTFRGESQFSTWLRVITNRQIANYYRKNKNMLKESQLETEMNLLTASSQTENGLNRVFLRQGLMNLPEHYREVLLLRFAEGMKFQEIADYKENSLDATKSLFRRAIEAIRTELGGSHA